MPPFLSSVWAVTASVLLTGGLHEDGLADTADGFGGGATPARKLEIMRDSRIGSYGALALTLSLIVRIAALAALGRPFRVLMALVVAASCGRSAMVVPLYLLRPARPEGLSRMAASPPLGSVVVALVSGPTMAFALMPPAIAGRAVAAMFAVALLLTWAARRQIAGHTGDVLGATSVVTEAVVLSLTVIIGPEWRASKV
jgi:adenosylcobinamide-GDP ribazoletransferase